MKNINQQGFTISELFIVAAVLFVAGFFTHSQWQYFQLVDRNDDRVRAVNAMHHYLQEVYFPENNSYPAVINSEDIEAISQDELRDPAGRLISNFKSDLRYEPGSCSENSCQAYTLRADLEEVEDFIRSSSNN